MFCDMAQYERYFVVLLGFWCEPIPFLNTGNYIFDSRIQG